MNLDVLLLISGGLIAILAGGLVAFLAPARYASLLAATALASLGLLQFGWARAIYDLSWSGGGAWFELSLVFALPVSLCWLLLSLTLFRGPYPALPAGWRAYVLALAVFSAAALAFVTLVPSGQAMGILPGMESFPLRSTGSAMVAGILLNLVLSTANFESTYLSLSRAARVAFRPGLLGILLSSGFFAYVSGSSLLGGRVFIRDLSLGALAVACTALLLPITLLRGRIAEVRMSRAGRPVTSTASVTISIGFLTTVSALISITSVTGWSLARAVWMVLVLAGTLGVAALAISNRLQRRFQRLIDPYLYRRRADQHEIMTRVSRTIAGARSIAELTTIIPIATRELVGIEPVTLFVANDRDATFIVIASTIEPAPLVTITAGDPLAVELRRARRAIRLRGRPDDLEFIPIYVENAVQIGACRAECAAPITRDEELFAFLLCGEQPERGHARRRLLPLLDAVCRRYSAHIEALSGGGSHSGLSNTGPSLHM